MDVKIKDLQNYLYEQYGARGHETGMFMKLVEEIGEVAEILNKRAGRKAVDGDDLQEQLANELVDVIHYAVAIAAINHIDLNHFILEKDKKAALKYHHERNLEEYIKGTN